MATFPEEDLHILVEGYSDDQGADPGVSVFETDRGPAKHTIKNLYTMTLVTFTIEFRTNKALNDFIAWYKTTIGKIGWFTWKDPRINYGVRTVRFKEGKIGAATPVEGSFITSRMSVTLEYLG